MNDLLWVLPNHCLASRNLREKGKLTLKRYGILLIKDIQET